MKSKVDKFSELRLWAETILRNQGLETTAFLSEDVPNLIHELQVHQIELEMQNETLHQTQQQLGESRDQYANLYDFAPVGYLTINDKGLIIQANLTAAALLGVSRSELLKMPFSRFIDREDQDTFYQYRRQVLATKAGQTCELTLRDIESTPFVAQLDSIVLLPDKVAQNGQYQIIISDITKRKQAETSLLESNRQLLQALVELKQAQAQMVQQERLAAIGRMAAGIAHDFNNILAIITLYTDLMLHASNLSSADRKKVSVISQQGQRAANLTQQILDFSRKSVMKRQEIDLSAFLSEVLDILAVVLPENILFSLRNAEDACMINGDPSRLEQVLMNLVINARQAMPAGGKLRIELTQISVAEEGSGPLPTLSPGEWAQIAIIDNGIGIKKEVLPHIFEPFFTTRSSLGSGLGLSQVYGIIKQHGGDIKVTTTIGEGTTFMFYLPILSVTHTEVQADKPYRLVSGNVETILIVEDNIALQEALSETLKALNYRTLVASNGREAITLCRQEESEIALIITDLIMPEMGGVELVNRLQHNHPAMKVLVLTGYPPEDDDFELQLAGVVGWMQKPVELELLGYIVAHALDEKQTPS